MKVSFLKTDHSHQCFVAYDSIHCLNFKRLTVLMTIAVMGHINPWGSHYMKAGLTDNFGVVTMNLLFSKAQGADVNFFHFQMLF